MPRAEVGFAVEVSLLPILLAALAHAAPPLDAVVLVQQAGSVCAGALVDARGTVATAYHCVAAGRSVRVETRDGQVARGRVFGVSVADDLALVAVPELSGGPWLPVREAPPDPGEVIWALGHPLGTMPPGGFLEGTLRWSATTGVVAATGLRALQVSAPVNPGNSGGPVVDGEGRLVGVVSRRLGGEGLGFATRADALMRLMADPRPMPLVGGTLELGGVWSSWSAPTGTISVGPYLAVVLRDRVAVRGGVAVPLSARWDAVRFGEVSWTGSEATVSLRQRLLQGPLSLRVEASAGVVAVGTLRGEADLSLRRQSVLVPLVAGALHLGPVGLDVGWVREPTGFTPRLSLRAAVPGTLWMF